MSPFVVPLLRALMGGALIGLAASVLWFRTGRVAGVSGILSGALRPLDGARAQHVAFLVGLVVAGVVLGQGAGLATTASAPLGIVLVAGLLVGFGARVSGGCTSGHGVCGLSRFSLRSLVATLTFIATGALTVFLVTHALPALGVGR
jgi:uncharacterized protein